MEVLNFLGNHWSEISFGITTIISLVLAYQKRGVNGALAVVIEAIGHNKGENVALKKDIAKKSGRRGFLGFLDAKVKELKRRNKTFRTISEIAGDAVENSIKQAVEDKIKKVEERIK